MRAYTCWTRRLRPRRARRLLALALCAAAALALLLAGCAGKKPPRAMRFPVTVARVETRAVPEVLEASGTVEPRQTVAVTCQVGGMVERVTFREGEDVRAGQVLFQIDPRPFRVALDQAVATMARDRAQAKDALAQAQRYKELVAQQYVAQQDYESKRAAAEALFATVRADSAAAANARLNLNYTTIRSPITGRAGNLMVHAGNLVKANDTGNPMVTVNQMRPILVHFAIPQDQLARVLREHSSNMEVTAFPDTAGAAPQVGRLNFVDNTVDPSTGTVLLKAEFPNNQGVLWPGQFVRVRLRLHVDPNAVTVPAAAVNSGQNGSFVYVVKPDTTVDQRPVQVGRTAGDLAVIASGVQPGETVVTDGQQRLTPGARVAIRAPRGGRLEAQR